MKKEEAEHLRISLRGLDITIRPITPEDNSAIADVIRNSFIDNKIDHLEAQLLGANEEYGEMQKLYLDKSVLGIGLGRCLIDLSIKKAREFGYKYLYLETLEELNSAVSLYEQFGFEHIEGSIGNTGHGSCEIWSFLF